MLRVSKFFWVLTESRSIRQDDLRIRLGVATLLYTHLFTPYLPNRTQVWSHFVIFGSVKSSREQGQCQFATKTRLRKCNKFFLLMVFRTGLSWAKKCVSVLLRILLQRRIGHLTRAIRHSQGPGLSSLRSLPSSVVKRLWETITMISHPLRTSYTSGCQALLSSIVSYSVPYAIWKVHIYGRGRHPEGHKIGFTHKPSHEFNWFVSTILGQRLASTL